MSSPLPRIEIVPYNDQWALWYAHEEARLKQALPDLWVQMEHIGSTAVKGLASKPVIDIMASVDSLENAQAAIDDSHFSQLGYILIETGMSNRLFLRCEQQAGDDFIPYHLHIVVDDTWVGRKERMMRDYLQQHPDAVLAYAELKAQLAAQHPHDMLAYTRGKTEFIQQLMNNVCDAKGWPRMDVWEV